MEHSPGKQAGQLWLRTVESYSIVIILVFYLLFSVLLFRHQISILHASVQFNTLYIIIIVYNVIMEKHKNIYTIIYENTISSK